jgi:uncharacterized membrane protein
MKSKKWNEMNRKERITGVVGLILIGFILLVFLTPSSNKTKEPEINTSQIVSDTNLTNEQKIEQIVAQTLKGKNNNEKDRFKSVSVSGTNDEGYIATIEFNASDNLSMKLRKTGIEKDMSEIYTSLYISKLNIKSVQITAYFPLSDQYGNEYDGKVYSSSLASEKAEKVNWEADSSALSLEILPNLWTTTFLHPEFL